MSTYELALFLHLLGVVGLFSGVTIAAVAHATARGKATAGEVATLLGLARTGVLIAGPSVLVVVVAGSWLVDELGLDWDEPWLRDALGLFVLGLLLGGVGGAKPKRARLLAESLEPGAEVTAELRRMLDDRVALVLNLASSAAMLGVLFLMATKPG